MTPKRKASPSSMLRMGLSGAPRAAAVVPAPITEDEPAAVEAPEPSTEVVKEAPAEPEPRVEPAATLQAVPDRPAEPEPEVKPARSEPAKRRPRAGKKLTPKAALQAVLDSSDSASDSPQEWENAPIRLRPDLKRRLDRRLAADQKAHRDRKLALAHYYNAAFLHVPDDVDAVLAMAQDHIKSLRANATALKPVGSGTRLHRDVAEKMGDLPNALRAAESGRHGLLVHVQCRAIEQLLDALDAADAAEVGAGQEAAPEESESDV
ncbi:hypothetical protein ABN028_19975 [Actinopolymorpha sp. B17G11]|uniref:hypothetical protein n=1 Tax=Actinopolymorpha sp. B17G11 TaxID=3160861 RepID=UPI0032E4A9A4